MNDSKKEIVQQEIAPKNETGLNGLVLPQPVVTKRNKAAAFFKRFPLFLLFGNRIKLKNKTSYITYMAILAALGIAISVVSFDFGPGGAFKLTFSYIPCFIAAIYFGPLFAAGVGVSISFSKFLFDGYLPWTLNIVGQALMGFLMGIFVQGIKTNRIKLNVKIILGAVAVLFAVTLGVNTVAFMIEPLYNPYFGWSYFEVLFFSYPPRIAFQPAVLALNTAITIILTMGLDRAHFKYNKSIYMKTQNNNIPPPNQP